MAHPFSCAMDAIFAKQSFVQFLWTILTHDRKSIPTSIKRLKAENMPVAFLNELSELCSHYQIEVQQAITTMAHLLVSQLNVQMTHFDTYQRYVNERVLSTAKGRAFYRDLTRLVQPYFESINEHDRLALRLVGQKQAQLSAELDQLLAMEAANVRRHVA